MTEITAPPPDPMQAAPLPMAAKPPGPDFAETLSHAQETASASPKVQLGLTEKTGKAAITQSNTESQSPDPQTSQPAVVVTAAALGMLKSLPSTAAPNAVAPYQPAAALPAEQKTDASSLAASIEAPDSTPVAVSATVVPPAVPTAVATSPKTPKASKTQAQVATSTPPPTIPSVPPALVASLQPAPLQTQVQPSAPQQAATAQAVTATVQPIASTQAGPAPELKVVADSLPAVPSPPAPENPATPSAATPAAQAAVQSASALQVSSTPASSKTPAPSAQSGPGVDSNTTSLDRLKETFGDIVEARSFRSDSIAVSHPAEQSAAQQPVQPPSGQPVNEPSTTAIPAEPQPQPPVVAEVAVQQPAPTDQAPAVPIKSNGTTVSRLSTQSATGSVSSPSASSALPLQAAATDDEGDDPADLADTTSKAKSAVPSVDLAAAQVPATLPSVNTTVGATQQAQDPTASPIDQTHLINQVADRIQLLAATRQQDGVVVHLQPPNLGSITLVVKTVASVVSAQVTATDDHVRSALELGRDQLGQQLQSRGYHLSSITVGSTNSSAGAGSSFSQNSRNGANSAGLWQGQQQSAQQNGGRSAVPRSNSNVKTETATPSRAASVSSSSRPGLDLWI